MELVCGEGRGLSHDLPFPEEGAGLFWQHGGPVGKEETLESDGPSLTLWLGQVSPLLWTSDEDDNVCLAICLCGLNTINRADLFGTQTLKKYSHERSFAAAAGAKSLQSCPTLCDPIDGSPPGSPIPGILQVRTLEWVAISLSNAWKWKVKGKSLSPVWLLATPWTADYQAPPSMGFSRQGYWSGLPFPSLERSFGCPQICK